MSEDQNEASLASTWARVPIAVARRINRTCGGSAFYTYVVLRSFDNPQQPGECFPSVEAIAERSGLSVRSVKRHIAKLKAAGALIAEGRGRHTNRYYFPFACRERGDSGTGVSGAGDGSNVGTTGGPIKDVVGPTGGLTNGVVRTTGGPIKDDVGPTGGPTTSNGDIYGDNPGHFVGPTGGLTPPLTTPPLQGVPDQYPTTTAPVRTATRQDEPAESAQLPVVVVEYLERHHVGRETLDVLHGQLARAIAQHGEEPVKCALAELAHALGNGQRPSCPQKLPNYFAPMLARHVRQCLRERRERERAEAQARAEKERMAQIAREAEERRRLGKRLFQSSRLLQAMRGHAAPRAP